MKKLNAFQLKVIAVVLMVADHVGEFAQPALIDPSYYALRYVGRIVFPVFLFLLVESVYKTSDVKRFVRRLWVWAIGMMVGSYGLMKMLDYLLGRQDAVYAHGYVEFDRVFYGVGNNIFLSLACIATVFLCIRAWKTSSEFRRVGIACIFVILALAFLFVDGQYLGLCIALAFFLFHGKPVRQYVAYAVVIFVATLMHIALGHDLLMGDGYNWMMIFSLPLIMLYNGERGPRTFGAKYFFYIFYPLHLWILYTIARLMMWR